MTVTFDMGGGISWTVNGLTITAQKGKTIDFGVATGTKAGKTIPVEVINKVTGKRSTGIHLRRTDRRRGKYEPDLYPCFRLHHCD